MKKYSKIVISMMMLMFIIGYKGYTPLEGAENKAKIRMATNAGFVPFEYREGDTIVGLDIDIAAKVAEKLGAELVVEDMEFDNLTTALQAGKVDFVAAGMTETPERAKNVDFSVGYYTSSQMMVVKSDEENIKSPDDLVGKRIGVQIGTTADSLAQEIKDATVSQYSEVFGPIQDLMNGKVDAVILDHEPAKRYSMQSDQIKMLPDAYTEESYSIAVQKGNTELLNTINTVIKELEESGEMDELVQKYFQIETSNDKMSVKEIFFGKDTAGNPRYNYLIKGLIFSLEVTVVASCIGAIIGLLIAFLRLSGNKVFSRIAILYIDIIRGTPAVVQLMIIYNIIFRTATLPKVLVGGLAFGINSGAYVAEIIRAGIQGIDKGQMEAGRSLGMDYASTMRMIIVPQAIKNILPTLVSEFIVLLKETSIVGFIAGTDLIWAAKTITSQTYRGIEPLLVVAVIYLVLTTSFTGIMRNVEKKLEQKG